jgi:hypothetical protein
LEELKKELDMLKNVQRTQADVSKAKQKTMEDDIYVVKEEKNWSILYMTCCSRSS